MPAFSAPRQNNIIFQLMPKVVQTLKTRSLVLDNDSKLIPFALIDGKLLYNLTECFEQMIAMKFCNI